jgi:hypothetical protein
MYLIRTPKALRMILLGVALVIYVKLRSFLAVDQLVRIYREVSTYGLTLFTLGAPHLLLRSRSTFQWTLNRWSCQDMSCQTTFITLKTMPFGLRG